MKFLKPFVLLLLVFLITSCKKPVPRMPVNRQVGHEFDQSINQNKILVKLQDKAFRSYIQQHPTEHYINSESGFWYAYLKKNKKSKIKSKKSDSLIYTYQVESIDNQLIYSKDEIGLKTYRVDTDEIISGLQRGLKLMKPDEVVKFLFPSFLACGVLGDQNKIKTNQQLIYTVYLKKIIINKNNKQ